VNFLKLRTMAQLRQFVQGTQAAQLEPLAYAGTRYGHVARVIAYFDYAQLGRPDGRFCPADARTQSDFKKNKPLPSVLWS
jgi:hypothetical protein